MILRNKKKTKLQVVEMKHLKRVRSATKMHKIKITQIREDLDLQWGNIRENKQISWWTPNQNGEHKTNKTSMEG